MFIQMLIACLFWNLSCEMRRPYVWVSNWLELNSISALCKRQKIHGNKTEDFKIYVNISKQRICQHKITDSDEETWKVLLNGFFFAFNGFCFGNLYSTKEIHYSVLYGHSVNSKSCIRSIRSSVWPVKGENEIEDNRSLSFVRNGCHIAVSKIDERRRAIVVKHSVVVASPNKSLQENGLQENYIRIEIIIQKYKALGATEIDEVKNERYDFR
ncbi:unnamed protein product [Brugia pahangi]|uniref:Secreted protein n=1 Tax=Brugia pahangi TaxID=6280 RepID=A0A158PR04_BRUPA|nr:unnamed protein product [Brugia pahangi]